MKRLRRKHVAVLHMRSGATFRCLGTNIKIGRRDGNELSALTIEGGLLPFYVRLDAIDTITTHRSWFRWGFW